MNRRVVARAVAGVLVVALTATGCSGRFAHRRAASTSAAGSAAPSAAAAGSATPSGTDPAPTSVVPVNRTVTVQTTDGQRDAIVVHPASAPTKPALVVMLHGGYGSGAQAEKAYGWDAEADRNGFVVAYPNGVKASWDVGNCCGPAQSRHIDDVAFLHALVSQLERTDGVDPARVYAVGMSNGAMMAYTWACRDPGELAAIGPVAGSLLTPCPSPRPITIVAIHGTSDENVPIDGGIGPKGTTGVDNPSLAQTLLPFMTADGCPSAPTDVTRQPPLTTTVWTCHGGQSVTTRIVDGAGHQWPGSVPVSLAAQRLLGIDPPSTAFDATDYLWQRLHTVVGS
jgi:polyhydroxybutyrate depolymerase